MPQTEIYLRRDQMLKLVGLSYTTVKTLISAGQFPAAVELTPHAKHSKIAWVEREIIAWQASRPRRGVGQGKAVKRKPAQAASPSARANSELSQPPRARPRLLPLVRRRARARAMAQAK